MFSTQASRERFIRVAQITLATIAICLAAWVLVTVTFIHPEWADRDRSATISIGVSLLWIALLVGYGVWLYNAYDNNKFGRFTAASFVTAFISPVMILAGCWGTESYKNFVLDSLMVIGAAYTLVVVVIMAFHRPSYMNNWIRSGMSVDEAKLKAAKAKRKMASNGEPTVIDDPDQADSGTYQQPPLMTDEEKLAHDEASGLVNLYQSKKLPGRKFVKEATTMGHTFGRLASRDAKIERVEGSWDVIVEAYRAGSIPGEVFNEIAVVIRQTQPAARIW